jgi:hypothetical protein
MKTAKMAVSARTRLILPACPLVHNRFVYRCTFIRNRLVSVWEESTCKYRAKVELAILCSFADFVPYKENVSVHVVANTVLV